MEPEYYEYLTAGKVQCPRCGNSGELPLSSNTGHAVEYAGVCKGQMKTGGICTATLILQVTAHQFPVQRA